MQHLCVIAERVDPEDEPLVHGMCDAQAWLRLPQVGELRGVSARLHEEMQVAALEPLAEELALPADVDRNPTMARLWISLCTHFAYIPLLVPNPTGQAHCDRPAQQCSTPK